MFEIVIDRNIIQNLSDYIAPFLKSLDIRISSKSTYQRQLKVYLLWLAQKKIVQPSREDLLDYKDYLKNDKELSGFTVGSYLTSVRRFFEWLEAVKVYPNIAKGIKSPKRRQGFRKDALTIEQVKKLLSSIDQRSLTGKRDYAMLNLMVRTGLRTIEVVRASREDISKQSGENVLFIHGKGRDAKDEIVVLTESCLQPIKNYINARLKVRDNDPLFVSHSTKNKGKRLTTRSVSRIVKNRLKSIGLDDSRMTAHSLRHTAVTLSLIAGATAQEARAMARHSNINTTLIYAHNINRVKNAPEHKIDSILET